MARKSQRRRAVIIRKLSVRKGDSVSANLLATLVAGATLREAMELANLAASIVVHQLGTTGSASVAQLRQLGFGER